MGIIKDKINECIDYKEKSGSYKNTSGTILEYEPSTNTATIRFKDPNNGEGAYVRENVPVSNSLGGVTGSAIRPGYKCSITFINGNVFSPVITGITASLYNEKTCSDQGAFLVDSDIFDVEISDNITPMSYDWLDDINNNIEKYINDYTDFINSDADMESYNMIRNLDKYSNMEQGITNLSTKSNVKMKENGDIDIFVNNNTGIRICPNNNTIEIWGNVFVNGKKIEF